MDQLADVNIAHAALIAVAVFMVPGFVINLLSGIRVPWAVAAATPTTFALFGFSGWLLSQLGIRYDVGTVSVVWAIACLIALAWSLAFYFAGRRRREAVLHKAPWWKRYGGGLADPNWILPAAGAITGSFLFLQRCISLFDDLPHRLADIPQGWDVQWHASEVRWVMDSGIADPTRMGELRNYEGHAQMYYPSGWHAGAGILGEIAHLTPIEATNLTGFVLPGIVLPLSVGLIAWRIVNRRGMLAQIGAGLSAVLIFCAPTVFWIGSYVGAWPYVAAMCMTGIVLALFMSIAAVPRRALAAGLGFMGLAMVHPSAVTVPVMALALWWLTRLIWAPSRKTSGFTAGALVRLKDLAVLALTGGIATAILLPQLLSGSASTEEVSSFTDLGDVSRAESWGEVFTMATRHHEEFGDINWTWLFVLAGIGAATALWRLNLWAPLTFGLSAWITADSIVPFADPWGGLLEFVGALHYNSAHRLIMPVTMFLFAAAGVGIATVIRLVTVGFLTQPIVRRISWGVSAVLAVAVAVIAIPAEQSLVEDGSDFAVASVHDGRMTNDSDTKAFDWLAKQPKAYEGTIMGDPADGHGWMYAYNGLPSIERHYLMSTNPVPGSVNTLYWHGNLAGAGNHGESHTRNSVDEAIDDLKVNYFVTSPPNFWAFQKEDRALAEWLYTSPGLTLVYKDGPVAIFAVNSHFTDEQLDRMRGSGSPDPLPHQATYGELGVNLLATEDMLSDATVDRGDTSQAPAVAHDADGNAYLYGDTTTPRDEDPSDVPYYHRPTLKDEGGVDITQVAPDPFDY